LKETSNIIHVGIQLRLGQPFPHTSHWLEPSNKLESIYSFSSLHPLNMVEVKYSVQEFNRGDRFRRPVKNLK
jgi:hypothetical protein